MIHARLHPRDRWPMDGRQNATVDFGAGLDPLACSSSDLAAPAEEIGLCVAMHETPPRRKSTNIIVQDESRKKSPKEINMSESNRKDRLGSEGLLWSA